MNEIIRQLEQYSIESKLLLCQKYSQKLMGPDSLDLSVLVRGGTATPTELETFSLFSILYDRGAAEEITMEVFSEIITELRNYLHPRLYKSINDGTYNESFMMISGLTQFASQENIVQRLYRYDYFFSYQNEEIDMRAVFQQKFQCNYEDFSFFAFCIYLISSARELNTYSRAMVLQLLFAKYNHIVKLLTITCDELLRNLRELHGDDEINYFYGLKIQYLYPLIETYDGIYLPNPYLFINAATESLINRITEGDPQLRRKFGKNVIEEYLFNIYSQMETIQSISGEMDYHIGKNKHLSPDVMAIESNHCVMFDTKAIAPSIKLREFNEEKIQHTARIIAENVVQLYKQINNYDNGYFNLSQRIEKSNVFGVVVLLEDNYISRRRIIDIAIQELREKQEVSFEEDQFIRSNIKILSLREIERAVFHKHSYMPLLINQKEFPEKWYDFSFTAEIEQTNTIEPLTEYLEVLKQQYTEIIAEISSLHS